MSTQLTVDTIYKNQITGWAIDNNDPQKKVHLILVHTNGEHEIEACSYREDLKKAGIGTGEYGFSAILHSDIDLENDSFKIFTSDGIELFTFMDKKDYCGYCDITDLIYFLNAHGHPSGIQKLQFNLVIENQKNKFKNNSYLIFLIKHLENFYIIPNYFLKELINNNNNIQKKLIEISHAIIHGCDKFKIANFDEGEKILISGAPWADKNYYRDVSKLKEDNNLILYQILYDLIPLRLPEHVPAELTEMFKKAILNAVACIDYFIPISKFTCKDLIEYTNEIGIKINRPHTIPLGNDGNTQHQALKPENLGTINKYVLFVSTVESRKNHVMMLEIWKSLYKKYGSEIPHLIFAGRKGWGVNDFYEQLNALNWLDGRIKHLEGLKDREIAWLYKNCEFTVFPSIAEGWGLPVSESLHYGKVCICSNNSSIPEAGANLAIAIDCKDFHKWLETIELFMINKSQRKDHEKKIQALKLPSWNTYNNQILQLIKKTVNTNTRINYFKTYKDNLIYSLGLINNEFYLENLHEIGNPNLILNKNDFYPVENSLVWSKANRSKIHIQTDFKKSNIAIGLKLIIPKISKSELNFLIKINSQKFEKEISFPRFSNASWILLENVQNKCQPIQISIELINPDAIPPINDLREIKWGIQQFVIIKNEIIHPAHELISIINGIALQ